LTFNNYAGIQQRFLNSARRIQKVWKRIPYPELVGQCDGTERIYIGLESVVGDEVVYI
jgi:hypothetical protein